MSAPRSLSIGMIGSGFNARFHIQALVAVRDCHIGGVSSPNGKNAKAAADYARELRVGDPKVFADIESMAADPTIDALWVNAPNHTRIDTMQQVAAGNARREKPLLGVACEKPLARNLVEAEQVASIIADAGIPNAYLENICFAPHVTRGKEILWRRAVPIAGRPYLARAAEEHGGPHAPWFWIGEQQGGGVLLDMMCHSLEGARWLLNEPGRGRDGLKPVSVQSSTASLKWTRPEYAKQLMERYGSSVDYTKRPSEDYAQAVVRWQSSDGHEIVSETTSSWSYVSTGLRHTFELLGPEYSMHADMSRTGLEVFFSRHVTGEEGEDLVEKQNAEQGLMPVATDEPTLYGYVHENRSFVRAFLDGQTPLLTFADGVEVVRLMMACYLSAETGQSIDPYDAGLREFVPAVQRGEFAPT